MSSSNVSHHSVNLPSPLPLLLLCLFFLIPVSFLIPLQAIIICMVISMSNYIPIKMYHLQCIFVIFVSILALIHPLNLMFLISPPPDTAICHCLGQVSAIRNVVLKRFSSFCKSALSSSSPLTVSVFSDSCFLPYTFTGYNNMYGYQHVKLYSDQDVSSAMYIRYIRLHFGFNSPFESDVSDLSTS